jgi:hypothetical protein
MFGLAFMCDASGGRYAGSDTRRMGMNLKNEEGKLRSFLK